MTLSHIITFVGWFAVPVCSAAVAYLIADRKRQHAHDIAMEQGMRALLRQQLIDYHRRYDVANGGLVPMSVKEQASAIHEAYHSIGGNGTGTQLWHEILEAPTK